jgi:hypothetical protein
MAAPAIHTYHCICTSLLLATTHTLSSLPKRAPPSLDSALILPLPSTPPVAPPPPRQDSEHEDTDSDSEHEKGINKPNVSSATRKEDPPPPFPEAGFTVLLSTILSSKPTIVRRSDGFEKRYLLRCGRCRLIVGYELDDAHFADVDGRAVAEGGGSGGGGGAGRENGEGDAGDAMEIDPQTARQGAKRTKVVYLLPAGIMSTEAMVTGKKVSETDMGLGDKEGCTAVAAWETI